MAPKAPSSRSREPSTEKHEKEPSSEEEEEEEDPKEESDDETEEGSSEEEEDDEKQDQQNLKTAKTPNPVAKSESKSTNGSDSDPDSEGSPSNYKLQPVPKPSASTRKRPPQEGGVVGSNKKSKTEEKKPPSTPGGLITRLWSDEDEIAVLNGMIDFRALKGRDPSADMGAFYDFIKEKLQADFSREQLRNKIRRLKERFLNALKKCDGGSDPVFSKPHEDISFELSKKIWGAAAVGNSNGNKKIESSKKDIVKAKETTNHKEVVKEAKETANSNHKEVVKEENGGEETDFWSKYPSLNESFHKILVNFPSFSMSESGVSFMKERLSLIGSAKAKQLDDKWRQLIVKEMEINYKMLALMTEQVDMAFDQ